MKRKYTSFILSLSGVLVICCLSFCKEKMKPPTTAVALANKAYLDTLTINGRLIKLDTITKTEFNLLPAGTEFLTDSELIDDKAHVFREGGTLRFILTGGDTFTLEDKINYINGDTEMIDDDYTAYYYVADHAGTNYWSIGANYYEGEGNFLMDKRTGMATPAMGRAILSPDKKYFASGFSDIMAGFNLNGLDVFENGTDGLVQKISIEPEQWGVPLVKWKDDSTLYFVQEYLDAAVNGGLQQRYVKLNLKALGL